MDVTDKNPKANVAIKATFCFVGICSRQTIGKGIANTHRSVIKLMIMVLMNKARVSMHPQSTGAQAFRVGTHRKMKHMVATMPDARQNPMVLYTTIRKRRKGLIWM